jgi:hypothetical protein
VQVFLSHNKADKDIARTLAALLVADGVDVWFDEWSIAAGDSIVEEINEGLRHCTHFVILWSKNASGSNWVRRELASILSKAIASKSPRVVPVVLDDTPIPELLADIKYISLKGDDARAGLLDVAKQLTGKEQLADYIREIVRLYHETITDPDAEDPFGLRACPKCGSRRLEGSSATDARRDELYFMLTCQDCGWSDWTQ